jgi:hypothetical protein
VSYPVKRFSSAQTGAPTLTGQAGALDALLYALLVTGFNLKSVQGIARSGAVATATFPSAHGYAEGDILLHAGADQAEYNGEVKIYNVTSTSYQFDVAGSPATPATGTITAKVAPAGWERVFTGTNESVYRAATGEGIRHYLRVDDTNAQYAYIVSWEAMTDIDTGSVNDGSGGAGRTPTPAQLANGVTWRKSSTSDGTARPWRAFADARLLHFLPAWLASASTQFAWHGAGEAVSNRIGDQYHQIVFGSSTTSAGGAADGNNAGALFSAATSVAQHTQTVTSTPLFVARDHGQTLSAVGKNAIGDIGGFSITAFVANQIFNSGTFIPARPIVSGRAHSGSNGAMAGAVGYSAYPDPVAGGANVAPMRFGASSIERGLIPGAYQLLHVAGSGVGQINIATDDVLSGVGGLPGRTLRAVQVAAFDHWTNAYSSGFSLFDETGPWR